MQLTWRNLETDLVSANFFQYLLALPSSQTKIIKDLP